ncbi:hypothetical protein Dcar01_03529 [Deinococcus carri]|uniref:Tail assembly chaperone n=1 Tax=Deinococcus carri TaxID=1211323 RepID=A0ABP9WBS2_9DEIO
MTDRTKSALAVLGQPDRKFAYDLGGVPVPYLALSNKELDLIDAIPTATPEGLDDAEMLDFLREKRWLESEAAYHMLCKRLGTKGPQSVEEVHDLLNADLFYPWVNSLMRGDKGEPVGATDSP